MGTPLFSTPKSIAEKDIVYDAIKNHLSLATVAEMKTVAWENLLAAYEVCDPNHALGEQAMVDGEFLDENWAERVNFAAGTGEVMIGATGKEGTVVTLVLSAAPTIEPKPTSKALITALSSLLPSAKLSPILEAYAITASTPQQQLTEALLAIVEDIMWHKAVADLASKLRSRGTKVLEYCFEQYQPFTGEYKGLSAHALDLAYLHGDPSIFAECEDPGKELQIQDAIQSSWIAFANGEKPWDEEKMRVFGPEGKVMDAEKMVVEGGIRRGDAWMALDGLMMEEKTAFVGLVLGFYAQLVGRG